MIWVFILLRCHGGQPCAPGGCGWLGQKLWWSLLWWLLSGYLSLLLLRLLQWIQVAVSHRICFFRKPRCWGDRMPFDLRCCNLHDGAHKDMSLCQKVLPATPPLFVDLHWSSRSFISLHGLPYRGDFKEELKYLWTRWVSKNTPNGCEMTTKKMDISARSADIICTDLELAALCPADVTWKL